ncbi:MAG: hypothetical protein ACRDS9_00700 [Pseudonocardiaceae bacterium]
MSTTVDRAMDINDISDRAGGGVHTTGCRRSRPAGVPARTSGTASRWRGLLLAAVAGLSLLSLSSCGDEDGTFYGDRSQLVIDGDQVTLRGLECGNRDKDQVTLETAEVLVSDEIDESGRLDESGSNVIWDDGDHETLLRSSDGTSVTIGDTLYSDMGQQDAFEEFKPRCVHE